MARWWHIGAGKAGSGDDTSLPEPSRIPNDTIESLRTDIITLLQTAADSSGTTPDLMDAAIARALELQAPVRAEADTNGQYFYLKHGYRTDGGDAIRESRVEWMVAKDTKRITGLPGGIEGFRTPEVPGTENFATLVADCLVADVQVIPPAVIDESSGRPKVIVTEADKAAADAAVEERQKASWVLYVSANKLETAADFPPKDLNLSMYIDAARAGGDERPQPEIAHECEAKVEARRQEIRDGVKDAVLERDGVMRQAAGGIGDKARGSGVAPTSSTGPIVPPVVASPGDERDPPGMVKR